MWLSFLLLLVYVRCAAGLKLDLNFPAHFWIPDKAHFARTRPHPPMRVGVCGIGGWGLWTILGGRFNMGERSQNRGSFLWTLEEAEIKEVTQIGISACGATAVLNVLVHVYRRVAVYVPV